MTFWPVVASLGMVIFLPLSSASGQAFGEYGRVVGSIPHGQGITGAKMPGGVSQEKGTVGGVGGLSGQSLPDRLIVASKSAVLYPRQDDETEKIGELSQGETLLPMMQSVGGSSWYMVKTSKGVVGWVKATDVREERVKK